MRRSVMFSPDDSASKGPQRGLLDKHMDMMALRVVNSIVATTLGMLFEAHAAFLL